MLKTKTILLLPLLITAICGISSCNRGDSKAGDIRYEYRIVSTIPVNTPFENVINKMAEDGWRLIQVTHRTANYNGSLRDGRRDEAQSITLSANDQYEYIFERPKK